jgi:tetratricopeptide (TPR) repeat protein
MGGSAPAGIAGASLVPLFTGKEADTAVSYAESLYPKINLGWAELRGVRTNEWKYIRAPKPELYDLVRDPQETRNVLSDHPDMARKLEAQVAAASATDTANVETTPIDERTLAQLKSLGYTSGAMARSYKLNGEGADPKDRVAVLRLIDAADLPGSGLSGQRRIELLQQAVALDPGNPLLYHLLGPKLEQSGRYDEAMKLYRTGLAQGLVDGRLHSRLADLLVRAGKKSEAIPEYEKAAQLNPADVASQVNLATAYMEAVRPVDAEHVFKAVIAIEPSNAAAQNGLGLLAIQRQDGNAARGYFEKAVELDPDLAEAHLNLGLLYKMAGDRAHARACFEQFLKKASPQHYKEVIAQVRAELAGLQ